MKRGLAALLALGLWACQEPPSATDALLAETTARARARIAQTDVSTPSIDAQHRRGDTLRPRGPRPPAFAAFTEQTPHWQTPTPLNFRTIRTNYDVLRVKGQFLADGLPLLHGAAVELSGAVMPIDTPPENGAMRRFWLASPKVVSSGCVFCNPPTLGDLVYVETEQPVVVNREDLYRGVVMMRALGRFYIDPPQADQPLDHIFRLQLSRVLEMSGS